MGVRIGVRGWAVSVDEGGTVLKEVKDGLCVGTEGSVEGVGRVPGPMGVWVPYRIVSGLVSVEVVEGQGRNGRNY